MLTLVLALIIVAMVVVGVFLLLAWATTEASKEFKPPLYERRRPGAWAVQLSASGRRRIKVVQLIREATGLGLSESKALLDRTPTILVRDIDHEDAEELVARLEALGAEAVALPNAEIAPEPL